MSSTRNLSADFDVAREDPAESRIFDNPLDRCPDHFTLLRRYRINVDRYIDPLSYRPPPHRSPDAEFPNAFFCFEKRERLVDKLLFFTRLFANIPRETEPETSSVVLDVPGCNEAPTLAAGKTISTIKYEGAGIFRIGATGHGYSAADRLTISLSGSNIFGGFQINGDFDVLAGPVTDFFHIAYAPVTGLLAGRVYSATGEARKFTAAVLSIRAAQSRSVSTSVGREYFLPGYSVIGSRVVYGRGDIPLAPKFRITDGSGTETNTLLSTTVPTSTAYAAMIRNGTQLLVEPPVIEDYLNTFLVRRSTFWTAQ